MDLDRYRSQAGSSSPRFKQATQLGARLLVIFAILFVAAARGYSQTGLFRVGLALLGAVTLPLLVQLIHRALPGPPVLALWQRRLLFAASVLILLTSFAFVASRLVVPR